MRNNIRKSVLHKGAFCQTLQIWIYIQQILDRTTISRDHVVRGLRKKLSFALAFPAGVIILVTGEPSKKLHMILQPKVSFCIDLKLGESFIKSHASQTHTKEKMIEMIFSHELDSDLHQFVVRIVRQQM